jgi:2,3-dihydro-2,3-dihydroxybenzoate dehydrogenase
VARLTAKQLPVTAYPLDVTSSGAVEEVVSRVERTDGPIDFLVNVAGVLRFAEVTDTTDEDWTHVFAVNTNGVFHTSRAVTTRMKARGHGAIVTVASNAASVPRVGMAAYAASKAAVLAFTKCLGLEVARHGVRCNVVSPGSTDTAMLRSLWTDDHGHDHTLYGSAADFRVGIPLGRIATPDDVAAAVMYLLSDDARQVTIQNIQVDGGAALGA